MKVKRYDIKNEYPNENCKYRMLFSELSGKVEDEITAMLDERWQQ